MALPNRYLAIDWLRLYRGEPHMNEDQSWQFMESLGIKNEGAFERLMQVAYEKGAQDASALLAVDYASA